MADFAVLSIIHMHAYRGYPDRAAVAVVSGVINMCQPEREEHAAPGMPVVVALYNVLAPITEPPIAKQKAEAAVFQIILMVAFNGIRNKSNTDLIHRTLPANALKIPSKGDGLVYFRVCKGLMLAFIPSNAAEDAEVLRDLLLVVPAKAILH